MSLWQSDDRQMKRQMRLNIIRHRQKLLKYLENIDDTVLKSKIKLDVSDLKEINLDENSGQIPESKCKIKEELIEAECDSSDDIISVGSEEWNTSYQKPQIDLNSTRKSMRIEAVQHNSYKLWKDKKKEDYEYDLDNIIEDEGGKEVKNKRNWKSSTLSKADSCKDGQNRPYRKPFNRTLHNAKERASREVIAMRFQELAKNCSCLKSHRRIPSKHSVLSAAKNECDMLTRKQNKLLAEKKRWCVANEKLRKKLRKHSRVVCASKVICLD